MSSVKTAEHFWNLHNIHYTKTILLDCTSKLITILILISTTFLKCVHFSYNSRLLLTQLWTRLEYNNIHFQTPINMIFTFFHVRLIVKTMLRQVNVCIGNWAHTVKSTKLWLHCVYNCLSIQMNGALNGHQHGLWKTGIRVSHVTTMLVVRENSMKKRKYNLKVWSKIRN